jgi:adenine-specific DNA-methyltransferase
MPEQKSKKMRGKVYTPIFIVKHILDLCKYSGKDILDKHIIDNSCGDGRFLCEIVERYINEAKKASYSVLEIANKLSVYIHGIEINEEEYQKCIKNLNQILLSYGIHEIKWDILCANATEVEKYNHSMDFVVGNPPYVRVHNLDEKCSNRKKYKFANQGMTDLYIIFCELGIKMLKSCGKLGYIIPNSFCNSMASKKIRKYIIENKLLTKFVNLKHEQVFEATTYTNIILLDLMNKNNDIGYYELTKQDIKLISNLKYSDFFIKDNFYFGTNQELLFLKEVFKEHCNFIDVKNGFATLKDNVFINNFNFTEFTIPVVKASTGEFKRCFFPYQNNKIIDLDLLTKNKMVKEYLELHKEDLQKRTYEKTSTWYAFGRSQGINDVYKIKYSINSVIKDISSIKFCKCDVGVGVYSGLYILSDISQEIIESCIKSDKFISYIKSLGKYKNGGYYTYSSKDLKQYLNYELRNKEI